MPFTTLDNKTALVLIDLQKGIVALPTVHPAADIVAKSVQLADAFRKAGRPVVFVNVAGGAPGRTEQAMPGGERPADWTDLVPDLDRKPDEPLFTKKSWGAFATTGIEAWLKQQGISHIVLAGIATSIGVESTARQAYEAGFNVSLVTDAMSDMKADAHENSLKNIFPRLGETGSTDAMLALLGA